MASNITEIMFPEEIRQDANFGIFIDQQLEAMEAAIYRVEYADLKGRSYLPKKGDVPAGADTYAYFLLDMFGRADIISPYSDEIPMVGIRGDKRVGNIFTIADAFMVSKQDLRAAAMNNFPLDPELGIAAMRAIEERVNTLILFGAPSHGLVGIFNHPDVTVLSAGADWDNVATTGATLLADMRRLVSTTNIQSQGKFPVNRIILPYTSYEVIANKPVDTAGSVQDTVLTVFQRGAPGVLVDWDINLETAGVGSTKRAVAYRNDPRVGQIVVPVEPEMNEPQWQNLKYKRIIDMRYGGVAIRQALAFNYMDGL